VAGARWTLGGGVLLMVIVLLVAGACTFEKRAENATEEETVEVEGEEIREAEEVVLPAAPEEAALGTLRAFQEAMAVGDLSLALALVDRDATLVDDLVPDAAEAASRGEVLLELRSVLAQGLAVEEESRDVSFPGGIAVVVSSLVLRASDEEAPDSVREMDGRRLHETAILVSTDDGWRIRHLHRSFVPVPS